MADTASDQPVAATASGDSQAVNAAATSTAASKVADPSAAAPPTADTTGKPEGVNATATGAPATSDGAAPPAADATPAETDKEGNADTAPPTTSDGAIATNGAPTPNAKDSGKRKSVSAQPKGGNLKKQKSMRELHLDVKPGQIWYVRMKGYPNWPAIVCDEDMLPTTLLEKRPVSAARFDGSYREDYMDGGKNARDRRYPVMFLGTNEFYWQVNTDLLPLDMQYIKDEVAKGERGKRTVSLWAAYQIAAEEHDLDYFKKMLQTHEEQVLQEAEAKAEREAKKQEKEARKDARKSKGGDDDVEMEDAEDAGSKKKKTPSKKRKEPADGVADEEQKGPKKIKIKTKGADEADSASAKKKKEKKPKAKKDDTPAKPAEPELTEQQKLEKKEKNVLFLRHKLQKGFLSRDQAPKEDEMSVMSEHIKQLEQDPNLQVSIIRNTKINKVMKAILKLETIPKEDTYHFKDRSQKLLATWNAILGTPAEAAATPTAEAKPAVNGDSHAEDAPGTETAAPEKKDDLVETKTDLGNAAADEGDVKPADATATAAGETTEETPVAAAAAAS